MFISVMSAKGKKLRGLPSSRIRARDVSSDVTNNKIDKQDHNSREDVERSMTSLLMETTRFSWNSLTF